MIFFILLIISSSDFEILNILSYFNIDELDQVEWVKMFSDVFRIAYLDRPKQKYEDSLELILSKDYAKKLFHSLKESKASKRTNAELNGEWIADIGHTTHLSASDIDGNVISLTQTIGPLMGSKVASDGLGLQNSTTLNANFLKDGEAEVPNFRLELNDSNYIVDDYVEEDYIEVRP